MTSRKRKSVTQQIEEAPVKPRRKRIKPHTDDKRIEGLVRRIIQGAKDTDASTRARGLEMRELKDLVESGNKLGGKTWYEWAQAMFKDRLDVSLVRLFNDIALAPDDEHRAVLLTHRAEGAKRSREFRRAKRKKADAEKRMALERQWIIRWAKSGSIAEVKAAWKHIRQNYDA